MAEVDGNRAFLSRQQRTALDSLLRIEIHDLSGLQQSGLS